MEERLKFTLYKSDIDDPFNFSLGRFIKGSYDHITKICCDMICPEVLRAEADRQELLKDSIRTILVMSEPIPERYRITSEELFEQGNICSYFKYIEGDKEVEFEGIVVLSKKIGKYRFSMNISIDNERLGLLTVTRFDPI